MKTYLERFNKMVDELKKHPQIEVKKFIVNPPATIEEFEMAEETFELTQDMIDFYTEANGIELEWTIKGETDGYDDGHIVLLPVQDVFQNWEESLDAEDTPEFEPLHPIDFFVPEACAALLLDGTKNPIVYFHKVGEEMDTLKLDFKDYLNALLITRGFFYWQSAIVSYLKEEDRFTEVNFKEKMPKLFPDFKLEDILKK